MGVEDVGIRLIGPDSQLFCLCAGGKDVGKNRFKTAPVPCIRGCAVVPPNPKCRAALRVVLTYSLLPVALGTRE